MLVHLRIVDFAIIDEVELSPGPGLNVLTGETGAGKSIIVGAVGVLRGGRVTSDIVRTGCKEAVVEALFDLTDSPAIRLAVEKAGLPMEDELLVRRVVARNGRGRIYVNGGLCTLAVLTTLTAQLLDISGQHEHQLLSDRATHRRILDALGVLPTLLAAVEKAYQTVSELAQALARGQLDDQTRTSRLDFLRYQLQELEAAELTAGEDQTLEQERTRLLCSAELIEAASTGERDLYSGDNSLTDRLARGRRQLEQLISVDERLAPLVSQLDEARVLVEDAAQTLRHLSGVWEMDPSRLQQIEERLDLLHRLKRKHGPALSEVLAKQETMREELAQLETLEVRLERLEQELQTARRLAEEAAQQLTSAREQAANQLSAAVTKHLQDLRMSGAVFTAQVRARQAREGDPSALCFADRRLGPHGWDQVEFLISTNLGDEARPISHVASGGELSRIMLALRRVLGAHDPVITSIYDEVDAGISGAVADVVGRTLAQVAQHRQVLCVTHLPQVAAYASSHFRIGKNQADGRMRTQVQLLSTEESVEELARLLGGQEVTDSARENARQLLLSARSPRTTRKAPKVTARARQGR
jgi:DNA repair protein RecN (Recombination protein N)